jgi:hypothetical protein
MRLAGVVLLSAVLGGCSSNRTEGPTAPVGIPPGANAFLDDVQARTFRFFWETTNPSNGLVPDRWPTHSFSSVAAIGFGLTAYAIGAERGYVTRDEARARTLTTLRFLYQAPQGPGPTGVTGYKGFFYHFLDMDTGLRFEQVELSTIDTALLLAGALFCREYYSGDHPDEVAVRAYADSMYRRVDWQWARARPPIVSMGWHPEKGFIPADWHGYDEGMILYVLALGSPTYPIEPEAWTEWSKTYAWGSFYGHEHVGFAPLFGHQYSHMWIDFRGIQDAYMRARGIDYFENSRRATYSQRAYAVDNPQGWKGYGSDLWGLTAVDGPKDTTVTISGRRRLFFTYSARGASFTEVRDDGTLAPTAAGGSVPFAPEITIRALMAMRDRFGDNLYSQYGFLDSFNPTFDVAVTPQHGRVVPGAGWFDGDYLGIDQGPIVAMIENYRSELVWKMMRRSPYIVVGLKRAGFTGGWLQ